MLDTTIAPLKQMKEKRLLPFDDWDFVAVHLDQVQPGHDPTSLKDWVEEQATLGAQRMTMKSIVLNPWFERGTSLVILANTIAMFCVYKGMEQRVKDTLHYVEVACLVCFVLEALCKAAGIGTSLYTTYMSNKDF